jgi:hypothetical protein
MSESLRKFKTRAYRYVLRPQDRKDMRFSLQTAEGVSGVEQTTILNLSETGCAFLVSANSPLHIGEKIKVEIPIPTGDQIAWWGRVVRVQEYEPRSWVFGKDPFRENAHLMVAVVFEQLPEGHSRALRKGIEQSFMKAMRDQQYRNWLYYRALMLQNLGKFLLISILAIGAFTFLWYLAQPSETYDPNRGAPWGDRIKFFK